jgi:pyridoxamine 5'-phosphate oxidase
VESLAELDRRVEELSTRFGDDIPLPPFWGGYRLIPDAIELWQSRPDRLHDRIRHERTADGWVATRLGP